MRRRISWVILASIPAAVLLAAKTMPYQFERAIEVFREDGVSEVYSRALRRTQGHFRRCPLMLICTEDEPTLSSATTTPESVGLSSERLEALRASLEERGTTSFLVARDGKTAFEWYAFGYGPNDLNSLAAAAKGITASVILLALLTDERLKLDQRVADFIPGWAHDSRKGRITIRQLVNHSSGIDEVRLGESQNGWKEAYAREDDARFRLALEAPILFEPGTRFSYSGLGYYPLAYALGSVLENSDEPTDLRSYLETRIMQRLGIPSSEWRISYGGSYEVDGMTLYAIGSGASYTARATARIGQLFVQGGVWDGQRLLDAAMVKHALTYSGPPSTRMPEASEASPGLGWWVNSHGFFPSLPEDAAVALGGGHQLLLVIPSLKLVAVRFGGSLSETDDDFWPSAEQEFFEPLMAAVVSDR